MVILLWGKTYQNKKSKYQVSVLNQINNNGQKRFDQQAKPEKENKGSRFQQALVSYIHVLKEVNKLTKYG